MTGILRLAVVSAVFIGCVALIAIHGFRGVVAVLIIALAATLPGTRGWKMAERPLVRLTGSRPRAAALVVAVVVGVLAAVNLYEYVR